VTREYFSYSRGAIHKKRPKDPPDFLLYIADRLIVPSQLKKPFIEIFTISKVTIFFDQGKIIEQGTHQQLLSQKGHYAHMWHMQAGGFLPDRPN